jgi:hypothetical protein
VPEWFLPIALFTSLLTLVLVFYEVAKIARGNQVINLLLVFILLPPLLLFVVSYLMRPLFVPRAFMVSSLIYYALAGRIVSDARKRSIALLVCMLIVLPAIAVLPSQYSFESFPRSPFQDAANDLAFMSRNGDVIVHDNKLSYFPMHFYQPHLPQEFIADEQGSHNDTLAVGTQQAMSIFPVPDLQTAVGNTDHVWFVVFKRAIEEYMSTGYPNHPQLTWLSERFNTASLHTYNDLLIYEFTR